MNNTGPIVWALTTLFALGALGCSADAGVAERIYLEGTVEPCENAMLEGVDPCGGDGGRSVSASGDATSGTWDIDPLTHENIFAYEMFELESYTSVPHIVIRGVLIPETDRCVSAGHGPARFMPTPTPKALEVYRYVVCYSDVAVSEYIYGSGPPKLTLRTGSRSLADWKFEDMVRHMKDRLRDRRHGKEKIYGLAPSYYNAQAVEVWRTAKHWPVNRNGDGEAVVESLFLEPVENRRTEPLKPEERARLVWPLDEFKRRIPEAFADFSETTSGKIWSTEHGNSRPGFLPTLFELDYPPLVTDIHDLHAHYRDELKAYENVQATPAVPPPAPGEPHSHPEPPGQRPAPTYTPSPE